MTLYTLFYQCKSCFWSERIWFLHPTARIFAVDIFGLISYVLLAPFVASSTLFYNYKATKLSLSLSLSLSHTHTHRGKWYLYSIILAYFKFHSHICICWQVSSFPIIYSPADSIPYLIQVVWDIRWDTGFPRCYARKAARCSSDKY